MICRELLCSGQKSLSSGCVSLQRLLFIKPANGKYTDFTVLAEAFDSFNGGLERSYRKRRKYADQQCALAHPITVKMRYGSGEQSRSRLISSESASAREPRDMALSERDFFVRDRTGGVGGEN